jgi:hypothetical protein
MRITKKFLEKKHACQPGMDFVIANKLIGLSDLGFIDALIKAGKCHWTNWLIVRVMKYHQYVAYAIYAAKQVIDIFEKKYPDDKRPRQAINAAIKCLKNPTKVNKALAKTAAAAAAYAAADAAAAAAYAAAYADADAYAAYAAADAAYAAAYADADAAYVAADAGKKKEMQLKILKYGIKLLKKK